MGEPLDATGMWARALRVLWNAAAQPTGAAIIRQAAAQNPPVKVTSSSWSDWYNGKNVPAEARTARWLVGFLRGRARRTTPGFVAEPDGWWEQAWERARAERQQRRSGRSPRAYPGRPQDVGGQVRVGVVPRQLPRQVSRFVGRRNELRWMDYPGEPRAAPISVISGTAGVGKTALALCWAHEARDRFADGDLYADLRGFDPHGSAVDPSEVLGAFLRALGTADELIPQGIEGRGALFRSLLGSRDVLVVLDNARDAAQVRPLLPGGANGAVVVTSRSRLDGLIAREGARRLDLDVLTEPEALELLREVLGAGRVDRELQAAGELVHRCARLPLALRIAAARGIAQPGVSLAELARRLEARGLDYLSTDDDDGISAVRAACSWSYQVLPRAQARLFRLLGLSGGTDVPTPVVAALAGLRTDLAESLLDRLAAACLIEEHLPVGAAYAPEGPRRWRMHDLLRSFSLECCMNDEPKREQRTAERRMLDWYLEHARALDRLLWSPNLTEEREETGVPAAREPEETISVVGTGQAVPIFADLSSALAWYDRERPAFLDVIRTAAREGHLEHAWKIPVALYVAYFRRRHLADLVATHLVALDAAVACGDRAAEARVRYGLGDAYGGLVRHAEAIASHEQALVLFEELGDRHAEARVLHGLAHVYFTVDSHQHALDLFLRSLDRFVECEDAHGIGHTLNGLGNALTGMERHAEALDYYERARDRFRESGDRHGEGHTLFRLGMCQLGLSCPEAAIEHFGHALQRFSEDGDHSMAGGTLAGLGDAHLALEDVPQAVYCFEQALRSYRIAEDTAGAGNMEKRIAEARLRTER
ncbi:tetratricopeptide repeat protein [Streptomyces sp. NPDC005329]|uniref:ATP-binding protein n=1 Tax=Streptomyces sp. NPDC005329 TaxID=3157034 RepID=UPI0033A6000F